MVKILFDLLQLLYSALPLITCVAVLALLSVLLSKSIKKHANVYYLVLGLPFVMVAIPFIGRIFGVEILSFSRIPFLGGILRDYIHAGTFGFPLLIIIMYMGALNPRIKWVKKLMSIRKELSILSGFPIFAHSLIRVSNNFPTALKYFTRHDEYMQTANVVNETGAWISNFSLTLGIVLLLIFIPLWATSFGWVRNRMGGRAWKKLQKWSYVLYALLFIHAIGIQLGGQLNPRGGRAAQIENAQPPANQVAVEDIRNRPSVENREMRANPESGHGRGQSASVADIKVDQRTKQYVHIFSLVLIFGSYLYLRLRKAKTDRLRKSQTAEEGA
jgi:DMSO/TMAO reductase YedYZ heme-binding membrane subunit